MPGLEVSHFAKGPENTAGGIAPPHFL